VLCSPDKTAELRRRIFAETSTLGVRESPRAKVTLDRAFVAVAVAGGEVAVKVGSADGVIVQVMPEFEDVAALARATGRPARVVLAEAEAAAAAAGLATGRKIPADQR
jgi:uncharacterized protein (DUF111 family)